MFKQIYYDENIKKKDKIVIVTGVFGVGKSSFIKYLSDTYNIKTSIEKYNENILSNYYISLTNYNNLKSKQNKDMLNKTAIIAQMHFITKRCNLLNEAIFNNNNRITVLDGSIWSDIIIAKSLYDDNIISNEYYIMYKEFVNSYLEIFNKIITKELVLICLHPYDINICLNNIKHRDNKIEKNIDTKYLLKIENGFNSMTDCTHYYLHDVDYNGKYDSKTFKDIIDHILN